MFWNPLGHLTTVFLDFLFRLLQGVDTISTTLSGYKVHIFFYVRFYNFSNGLRVIMCHSLKQTHLFQPLLLCIFLLYFIILYFFIKLCTNIHIVRGAHNRLFLKPRTGSEFGFFHTRYKMGPVPVRNRVGSEPDPIA